MGRCRLVEFLKYFKGNICLFFHFSRNSLPQVHVFFRAQEKSSSLRKQSPTPNFSTKNTCYAHFISISRKFVSISRKFISISRKFVSISRKFVSIPRKFISFSRKFIPLRGNSFPVRGNSFPVRRNSFPIFSFLKI